MEPLNFRLDGKTALITGAGRGIGLGMARVLAAYGAAVAIQDIDRDVATAEASRLADAGAKTIALGGDISDLTLPQKLIDETAQRLGPVDILINNAAIQMPEDWMEASLDRLKTQFDADLIAPIELSRLVLPHMRHQKWGRIIHLGSIQQRSGNLGMLAYSLSKVALEKLTKAMARTYARDQITVNCIAPGWVNTWRNRHEFKSPEDVQKLGKHVPVGRIGEAKDYEGITLLLCSDPGSYITGQTIFVDGGMSAGW